MFLGSPNASERTVPPKLLFLLPVKYIKIYKMCWQEQKKAAQISFVVLYSVL